jgi:hypothetical protein
MRRSTRWACLTLALGLGLTAVVATVAGLSTVLAAGQADVTIDLTAPTHVAPSSPFVVNIAYANIGTEAAPDVQVTATLPDGVQFITAPAMCWSGTSVSCQPVRAAATFSSPNRST